MLIPKRGGVQDRLSGFIHKDGIMFFFTPVDSNVYFHMYLPVHARRSTQGRPVLRFPVMALLAQHVFDARTGMPGGRSVIGTRSAQFPRSFFPGNALMGFAERCLVFIFSVLPHLGIFLSVL